MPKPRIQVTFAPGGDFFPDDGFFVDFRRELDAMPGLRWVQLPSAGADRYVGNARLKDDVALTTASGVFGVAGAERDHRVSLDERVRPQERTPSLAARKKTSNFSCAMNRS